MARVFVPGFKHDVFISYARADNQTTDDGDGWVTTFKLELQRLVNAQLDGFKSNDNFFFDNATLETNTPVNDRITDAASNSAVLLVVLTNAYKASPWCRQERDLFIKAAEQTGGTAGRMFLVQKDALDAELTEDAQFAARPTELQDIKGVSFYKVDKQLNVPETFRTDSDDFGKWINVLRYELVRQLRSMMPASEVSGNADNRDVNDPAVVYLSEVPGELKDEFATLKTALAENLDPPIRLVPTESGLWRAPPEHESCIRSALDESDLFVQLLGCQTFPPRDAFAGGFEPWLADLAKSSDKPILRWRDTATYPQDELADWVTDEDRLRLLLGAAINTQRLPQFQELIIQECRKLRDERRTREKLSQSRREPTLAAPQLVLLKADKPDLPQADELGDFLLEQQIGIDVINGELSLREVTQDTKYDAVILYYGTCDPNWVSQQVKAVRDVMIVDAQRVPRRKIVYAPPPIEGKRVRTKLPGMRVVQSPNEDESKQALLKAVVGEDA